MIKMDEHEKEIQKKVDVFFGFFTDPENNMQELSLKFNKQYEEVLQKNDFVVGTKGYVRSPLEYAFALILEKLGIRFFTQWRIFDMAFDFYLPDLKVFIELDGKNYHLFVLDNKKEEKCYHNLFGKCKKCGAFHALDKKISENLIRNYEKSREPAKYGVRFIKFISEEIWTHKYDEKPKLNKGVLCMVAQELIDLIYSPADKWLKDKLLNFIKDQGGN